MAPSQKLAPFSLVLRGEGLGMRGGRLGSGWQLKLHTSFRANNAATPQAPLTLYYLCFLLFVRFSVPFVPLRDYFSFAIPGNYNVSFVSSCERAFN
jgi:hypothetical protein